jgi:hypothetical protein
MITVTRDFETRVGEIEAYVAFLAKVDEGAFVLADSATNAAAYSSQDREDLLRTFKASALLLLYNLMESTVSNAVEAIYDELSSQGITFDSCRQQVRRIILRNLKQHDIDALVPLLGTLSTDVVTKTFQKRRLVSGNVDAQKIREMADEYGFDRPAADGTHLLEVKTKRNDLAHGAKSFAEVGRDYPMGEVVVIKDKVITYLRVLLQCVSDYIADKRYLEPAATP